MINIIITILASLISMLIAIAIARVQISQSRKQSVLPILYIDEIKLIPTNKDSEKCELFFEKYRRCEKNGTLSERKVAKNPSTIQIKMVNSGLGLLKNFYIFNKSRGETVRFYEKDENIWFKKGKIVLAPNRGESYIQIVPQYIREEKIKQGEEKCSDYCDLLFYYSDVFNNYYVMEIRMNIIFLKSKNQFAVEYHTNDIHEINKKKDKKIYKGTNLYKIIYKK